MIIPMSILMPISRWAQARLTAKTTRFRDEALLAANNLAIMGTSAVTPTHEETVMPTDPTQTTTTQAPKPSLLTSVLSKFSSIAAIFAKYGAVAQAVVRDVEAAMPNAPGASKKQVAVAIVLAAVHDGEQIPIAAVQSVSYVIDTLVTVANGLGLFGKAPTATVSVPTSPTVQLPLPSA